MKLTPNVRRQLVAAASDTPLLRQNPKPDKGEIRATLNRLDKPPAGAGEAATCPVAAAIGNAIVNATGIRLRQYPFTPARINSALAAQASGKAVV